MKNNINLLHPSTGMKSNGKAVRPSKPLGVVCLLLAIITVGAYGILYMLQGQAQEQLAVVRQDINTLVKSEKANQVQENLIFEWNQMSTAIEKLNAERPRFSGYLDELKTVTPQGIILTNVLINEEPFSAALTGIAPSLTKLAQFDRNLQESKHFRNCIMTRCQKRPQDGMYEFTLTVTFTQKGGSQS